jgi:hypothetical protein
MIAQLVLITLTTMMILGYTVLGDGPPTKTCRSLQGYHDVKAIGPGQRAELELIGPRGRITLVRGEITKIRQYLAQNLGKTPEHQVAEPQPSTHLVA